MFNIFDNKGNEYPITLMNFPDKEGFVKFFPTSDPLDIVWRYEGDQELMTLGMICDIFKHHHMKTKNRLFIPYFPHARQDRHTHVDQPFSLNVFENLLNVAMRGRIEFVSSVDVHSDVCWSLIENKDRDYKFVSWPSNGLAHRFDLKHINCLICPDKGAVQRTENWANYLNVPILYCTKHRDASTGKLSDPELVNPENLRPNWNYLLVDDIGTGFGTHIQLGNFIKAKMSVFIDIFVTHAGFSRGLECVLGVFDNIYCTNSLMHGEKVVNDAPEELKKRVHMVDVLDIWRTVNDYKN